MLYFLPIDSVEEALFERRFNGQDVGIHRGFCGGGSPGILLGSGIPIESKIDEGE